MAVRWIVPSCLALLVGTSCLSGDRAYPLYPAADPALPRSQVARLGGYVARVDGRDVSDLGGSFELLPGCHVVETPTRWGKGSDHGAVVATTGTHTFALPMRAGHGYAVVVDLGPITGPPVGSLEIRADETDAKGELVRSYGPARASSDIEACRRCASDFRTCDHSR